MSNELSAIDQIRVLQIKLLGERGERQQAEKMRALTLQENSRLKDELDKAREEANRGEELRHLLLDDANRNGKTILDFMNVWLDQARKAQKQTEAELARHKEQAIAISHLLEGTGVGPCSLVEGVQSLVVRFADVTARMKRDLDTGTVGIGLTREYLAALAGKPGGEK